jgi:hypothetical protein
MKSAMKSCMVFSTVDTVPSESMMMTSNLVLKAKSICRVDRRGSVQQPAMREAVASTVVKYARGQVPV